jgi:hypothetical protein
VQPLEFQPAVVTGPVKGATEWMGVGVDWYKDFTAQDVFLAAAGPKEWERVAAHSQTPAATPATVGSEVTVDPPARRPVDPAQVSRIRSDDNDISFDVDHVGTPVLVKASYFPNWKVSGAKGPYRVTPNLMVVIPTSRHVNLHYGYTPVDGLGYLLTLGGVALAIAFARRGPVRFEDPDTDAGDEPVAAPEPRDEDAEPVAPASRPPVTVLDRGS